MTKEEIKDAAKVMEAYANGKKIQFLDEYNKWIDVANPSFNWSIYNYRIKPEPKYRPFKNQEECWNEMHKHLDFGWLREKESGYLFNTIAVFDSIRIKENAYNYSLVFKRFEFLDGAPFGVKEE